MVTLDRMYLQILDALQQDARTNYTTIADELDRAESTVRDRIRRLEEAGFVDRYTAVVDDEVLGLDGKAQVRASVPYHSLADVTREVRSDPRVRRVYHTGGGKNLAFTLVSTSVKGLERDLAGLTDRTAVEDLDITIVTDTVEERQPLPLTKLLGDDGDIRRP